MKSKERNFFGKKRNREGLPLQRREKRKDCRESRKKKMEENVCLSSMLWFICFFVLLVKMEMINFFFCVMDDSYL